ncbi:MAG TPA: hypothetical protein VKT29_15650, partial [Terriglobales bacterium]|nr:hypothetical protein [Terriglobales bacterium]
TTTQPGTPSQPGSTPQTATGPQTTVEGCLSGTPGEYSLITKSGQVYSLAGDDSLLGNHVGEEVRVTGAQSNSSAAGASAPSATPGNSASTTTGGSAYGSTGTAGSQPGATTQSQTGSVPNQSNPPAGQPGSSPGSAANSPAAASTTQSGTPQIGSGTRFQVSNVTETSGFCNMAQPH